MLPGFRFLLAAIVLSVSIVIFGLGAAALLRAAHEEFASIPARRTTPEPYFAQPAQTLAMLRVEPALHDNAPVSPPAPVLVEEPGPEAAPVPKVDMEKLAALREDVTPPAEAVKPEIAASEPPAVAPSAAEPQAETKMAALDAPPMPTPVVEDTPKPSEPVVLPAMTDGSAVIADDKPAAKIAALGSPATTVTTPAETKKSTAKPDRSEIRKKQRAERARERRRLAARRARLAAQQAAIAAPTASTQQPADLLGEAAPQTRPATRRR